MLVPLTSRRDPVLASVIGKGNIQIPVLRNLAADRFIGEVQYQYQYQDVGGVVVSFQATLRGAGAPHSSSSASYEN